MPTKKTRVNLVLDDDMVELLDEHKRALSVGGVESRAGAAIDLIRRGAEAYYRMAPGTLAANADNLKEKKRAAAVKKAADRAAAKYWSAGHDGDRKD